MKFCLHTCTPKVEEAEDECEQVILRTSAILSMAKMRSWSNTPTEHLFPTTCIITLAEWTVDKDTI